MNQQTDIHNRLAGLIVASIVRQPLEAGGSMSDVIVLCESVIVGVALACVRLGGDEAVLDEMFKAVKIRLAELRLSDIKTSGSA